jgi:hypothetical protein
MDVSASWLCLVVAALGAHSPAMPSLREALPPGVGWWCARLPSGEGCFRTRAQCEAIRGRAGVSPRGVGAPGACASRSLAWCFAPRFATPGAGGTPTYRAASAVCAGDARGCARRRREMLALRVPGEVAVDAASECESAH